MRTNLPSGTPVETTTSESPDRGVVLVPDIMGLRPLFDDMVVRLARDYSWSVAAVEPFPGHESMTLEERLAARAGLDDDRQLAAIAAAADLLATSRVAILGFCM